MKNKMKNERSTLDVIPGKIGPVLIQENQGLVPNRNNQKDNLDRSMEMWDVRKHAKGKEHVASRIGNSNRGSRNEESVILECVANFIIA